MLTDSAQFDAGSRPSDECLRFAMNAGWHVGPRWPTRLSAGQSGLGLAGSDTSSPDPDRPDPASVDELADTIRYLLANVHDAGGTWIGIVSPGGVHRVWPNHCWPPSGQPCLIVRGFADGGRGARWKSRRLANLSSSRGARPALPLPGTDLDPADTRRLRTWSRDPGAGPRRGSFLLFITTHPTAAPEPDAVCSTMAPGPHVVAPLL